MNPAWLQWVTKLKSELTDTARRTIMALILALLVLMLTAMWLLSSFNLNFSQSALSEVRHQQIAESFEKGLERISFRQFALERYTTTLAKLGESFFRLKSQDRQPASDTGKLQAELETALVEQVATFKGASSAGIWFEPGIFATQNRSYAAVVQRSASDVHLLPADRTGNYHQKDWYQPVVQASKPGTDLNNATMRWTPVYFDLEKEQAIITLSVQMFDINGRTIGMVTTDWTAETVIDLVSQLEITPGSFSFLLDQNNRKLSNLNERLPITDAQNIVDAVISLNLVSRIHATTAQSQSVQMSVNQRDYELIYASTPGGMVYGVGIPQDEIDSVLVPLRMTNWIALLVTAFVLLPVCIILLRSIYKLMLELRTAYTDSLTGLANRTQLLIDLNNPTTTGLILINIDRFKESNSLFGQECGDHLLRTFARQLQVQLEINIAGARAKVYRLPGDEFVIAGNFQSVESATRLIDNLQNAIGGLSVFCNDQELSVDFTCGAVIEFDDDRELSMPPRDGLLTKAAVALKEARKRSRNYQLYDESQSPERIYEQNIYWAKQLRYALINDRICPYFQPIRDNQSGAITKYECLIRMIDDHKEVISPGRFLDIAHRLRLDRQLTNLMVDKCFKVFASLPYEFSINLSYADLLDDDVVENILNHLASSQIGSRVIFEILESDGIENYEEVLTFITAVKAYGCRIAIDDFGTGYSNFEHLLRLNVDIIKIDGSLIKSIDRDPSARMVTEGIVDFAHRLGISVVAEFVHNQQVQLQVEKLKIDFSQGYFIGVPDATPELGQIPAAGQVNAERLIPEA